MSHSILPDAHATAANMLRETIRYTVMAHGMNSQPTSKGGGGAGAGGGAGTKPASQRQAPGRDIVATAAPQNQPFFFVTWGVMAVAKDKQELMMMMKGATSFVREGFSSVWHNIACATSRDVEQDQTAARQPPHFGSDRSRKTMIRDDDDDGDAAQAARNRPIQELDALSLRAKIEHVLLVAQPYGDRRAGRAGPWFPKDAVPDTAAAAKKILAAQRHALRLWGTERASVLWGMERASAPGRDPVAVLQWRDVWTHPTIYRRVFGEWLGRTYVDREAVEEVSGRAAAASRAGHISSHPAPSWNRANSTRGLGVATTWLCEHGAPERYGHRTGLVPSTRSWLAQENESDLWEAAKAAAEEQGLDPPEVPAYVPGAVVRLADLSWYLRGFLSSVIVWTHLALTEAPTLKTLGADLPTKVGFSVYELVRDATGVLGLTLGMAWNELQGALRILQSPPFHPIPDVVRVPQEWCQSMSPTHRGEEGQDVALWTGVTGDERRLISGESTSDLGLAIWMVAHPGSLVGRSLDDAVIKAGAVTTEAQGPIDRTKHWQPLVAFLRMRQAEDAETLYTARAGGTLRVRRVDLVERYAPLPQPPHPVPSLFLPWSGLTRQRNAAGSWTYREEVHRLASVRTMAIHAMSISCLETALALEEWGRTWSDEQREHQDAEAKLTPQQKRRRVRLAILGGQSVPVWDDGARRRFVAAPIAIANEQGPMGDGYRLYEAKDRVVVEETGGTEAMESQNRWLRVERMNTVERMWISSFWPDYHGRWEDSGIELPSTLTRFPGRDRLLRSIKIAHPPPPDSDSLRAIVAREISAGHTMSPKDKAARVEYWRQAAGRAGRRAWKLRVLSPWPVSLDVEGVDLGETQPATLTEAPVVRQISLHRVAVPHPAWMRNFLTMPAAMPVGRDQDLDMTLQEWRDVVRDAGLEAALRPSARRTLVMLALDSANYKRSSPGMTPVRLAAALFPGIPTPLRRTPQEGNEFRPYPNLTLVSVHASGLGDVPRGLIDLAISTRWNVPATPAPAGGRARPPLDRMLYWDLSDNAIEELSASTLISLIWFVRTVERRPRGTPRPFLDINLGGNPIAARIEVQDTPVLHAKTGEPVVDKDTKKPVIKHVEHWDPYIHRRLSGIYRRLRVSMKRQAPEARRATTRLLTTQAMLYWNERPEHVSREVASLFSLRSHAYSQAVIYTRRGMLDRQRHRWMI